MSKWKLEQWCVHAVHRIRYGPDRKAVYKELREHVDDRYEHFREQGDPETDATEKTLSAMGDAWEVAALLEKAHRPFWGYLYTFAKWAVILLAIVCLYQLLSRVWDNRYAYKKPPDEFVYGYQQVLSAHPDTTVTCDGYTITLTQASLWRKEVNYSDFDTLEELIVQLEITNPRPWSQPPSIVDWIWAEDSGGNHYYSYAEELPEYPPDIPKHKILQTASIRTNLFTTVYSLHIGYQLPESIEWIDLRYTRDGRDWTLRIDLTGGTS